MNTVSGHCNAFGSKGARAGNHIMIKGQVATWLSSTRVASTPCLHSMTMYSAPRVKVGHGWGLGRALWHVACVACGLMGCELDTGLWLHSK